MRGVGVLHFGRSGIPSFERESRLNGKAGRALAPSRFRLFFICISH